MSNFEYNSLFIGQLKELLHSFNFPLVKPYKGINYEGRVYIKNKELVKYINGEFLYLNDYLYNKPVLNLTEKFKINSSDYDNYTHEMLGEYLRCQRDLNNVNLMSLYNCFNGDRPYSLNKTIELDGRTLKINTSDSRYNYYILPVKFDEYYTIAIDANCAYDIMCIIYDNSSVEQEDKELIKQTYKRVNSSKFSKPFVYSTFGTEFAKTNYSREKYLKMLIKIPVSVKSTITILEGDFSNKVDTVDGRTSDYIFGDQELKEDALLSDDMLLKSKISLLSHSDNITRPFSDRLIEYILGQAITSDDKIYKNIERVQKQVYTDFIKGYLGVWDNTLRFNIFKEAQKEDETKGSGFRYGNKYKKLIDNEWVEVSNKDKKFCELYSDLTYFVDKDIESALNVIKNADITLSLINDDSHESLIDSKSRKHISGLPEPTLSVYLQDFDENDENKLNTNYVVDGFGGERFNVKLDDLKTRIFINSIYDYKLFNNSSEFKLKQWDICDKYGDILLSVKPSHKDVAGNKIIDSAVINHSELSNLSIDTTLMIKAIYIIKEVE